MSTVFYKQTGVATGRNCLILEPREACVYPFNLGTGWSQLRVGMLFDFCGINGNNSVYSTENISAQQVASYTSNKAFFGFTTDAVPNPYDGGNTFFGAISDDRFSCNLANGQISTTFVNKLLNGPNLITGTVSGYATESTLTGVSGFSGFSGQNGFFSGFSGLSGISTYPFFSGISGFTGSTGFFSGYSGYSYFYTICTGTLPQYGYGISLAQANIATGATGFASFFGFFIDINNSNYLLSGGYATLSGISDVSDYSLKGLVYNSTYNVDTFSGLLSCTGQTPGSGYYTSNSNVTGTPLTKPDAITAYFPWANNRLRIYNIGVFKIR